MGCSCCKSEEDQNINGDSNEYSKERLHVSVGKTQIDVKNGNIHEIEAQCYVSVIDNKGIGDSSNLLKHYKHSKKELQDKYARIDVEKKHDYGTILPLFLDNLEKQGVFLVLPIWRKGEKEKKFLNQAILELINYLKDNHIKSVVMDDVGVKSFGYPRQLVIECLVTNFDNFLIVNQGPDLERICFVSNEMTTVGLFEAQIRKTKSGDDLSSVISIFKGSLPTLIKVIISARIVAVQDQFRQQSQKESRATTINRMRMDENNSRNFTLTEAQCYVSVIDNKGIGSGSCLLNQYKQSKKELLDKYPQDIGERRIDYGTIIPLVLDNMGKQGLFLVLPLYVEGEYEKTIFNQAILNLIDYLKDNRIRTIVMDDIGVKMFGYPRQFVISCLVTNFDHFIKNNKENGLERVSFVLKEKKVVKLFQSQIKSKDTEELGGVFSDFKDNLISISKTSKKPSLFKKLKQTIQK